MSKSIFKIIDEYGPIEVLDEGDKRYLTFGNDHEQSLQIKAMPHIPQHEYSRAIMLVLLFAQPERVCLLGLGGGTLAMAFMNSLPDATIEAVELRPAVVSIAKRFFQLPKHGQPKIHQQDAAEFLQQTHPLYDLMVVDLYHFDGIDEAQLQQEFLKNCAKQISESGWLVLNYWVDHDLDQGLLSQLENDFSVIFMCISGGGNCIIYAGRSVPQVDYLAADVVKPLAKQLGFSLNYYLKRLQLVTSAS